MNMQTTEQNFIAFKKDVKTLHLSTITIEGKPNGSYSPFVVDKWGNFYIFISQLASHTQDLLAYPEASILLIQDEVDTRQIFARQRISYQCSVDVVDTENMGYQPMLDLFEKRFGNVVELLRSLPDFLLFKLSPNQGRYVEGFGKAYDLVGDGLLELEKITPKNN